MMTLIRELAHDFDPDLVDKLHEVTDSLSYRDAERTLAALRQSLRHSKRENNPVKSGWVFFCMAMVLRGQRRYHSSIKVLDDARAIFEAQNETFGNGCVLQELSIANRELQRNALALEYADQAMRIFQAAETPIKLAHVYDNMAVIQFNLFHRRDSLIYAQKARTIFKELSSTLDVGWNACHLAHLLHEMGRPEEAKPYAVETVAIFKKIKNMQGVAWGMYWLSMIARAQSHFNEAVEWSVKAQKVFSGLRLKDRQAWCMLTEAAVRRSMGQLSHAAKINKQALQIFTPLRNHDGVAWSFFQLGRLYSDEGQYLKAWRTFREVFNIHGDVSNRKGTAWAQNDWGRTYVELDDLTHARDCFVKSLAIADQVNEVFLRAEVLKNLASLNLDQGLLSEAAASIAMVEEVFKEFTEVEFLTEFYLVKVRAAVLRGDLGKAQDPLEKALATVREYGLSRLEPEVLAYKAEVAAMEGRKGEARSEFKRALKAAQKLKQPRLEAEILMSLVQLNDTNSKADTRSMLLSAEKLIRMIGSRKLRAKLILLKTWIDQMAGRPEDHKTLAQSVNIFDEVGLPFWQMQGFALLIKLMDQEGLEAEKKEWVDKDALLKAKLLPGLTSLPVRSWDSGLPISLII